MPSLYDNYTVCDFTVLKLAVITINGKKRQRDLVEF